MLNLGYGSSDDDESDNEASQTPSTSTSAPAPKPAAALQSTASSASSALRLPPPTNSKSRRKDGPVKIKIDAVKPEEDSPSTSNDKPKPARTEASGRGAGGSGLVGLLSKLPAPKPAAAPPKPARVLGGGLRSDADGPGVLMESELESGSSIFASTTGPADESDGDLSFLPPSLAKPREKTAESSSTAFRPPSLKAKPPSAAPVSNAFSIPPPKPAPPAVDFFSLGASTSIAPPIKSTSISSAPAPSVSISSAPSVTEFQPPAPSITDPYPGYYQKPSGDWAAYDPVYYQSFWADWNKSAAAGGKDKGKRKEREWEGADGEGVEDVNMREEMMRSQIAQREATKGITTTSDAPAAQPKMNIKAKSSGEARRKGQLSALLVEAYENREAIEQRLAEGRRNRKEAGTKYGF